MTSRRRLRWTRARVSGPSMVPTLHDGDLVLAVAGRTPRPGELVLGRYRSLPGLLVVKRVVRAQDGGWWLASDNPFAGGDSAVHGVADVTAVVRWVLPASRRSPLRSRLPRRPAAAPPTGGD